MRKKNHKRFKLIVMILLCIYMTSIAVYTYAVDFDKSVAPIEISDVVYGGEEEVERDYQDDTQVKDTVKKTTQKNTLFKNRNDNKFFVEIRKNVGQWYTFLRLFCILIMLILLIVLCIRYAIANNGKQKANYRAMILDWVVCFLMLFIVHYFMIGVHVLNEWLIETFSKFGESISGEAQVGLYESVRSRAYDIKATVGFSGMIMYIMLVYLTVKYTLIYAKRFITLIILTILAPIIVLFNAMQKIMNGKSNMFSKWFEEYATNVLLQAIHVIIYTIFVSTTLTIAQDSLVGIILSFIFLTFMSNGEQLFRQILKFSNGSSLAEELSNSQLSEISDKAKSVTAMAIAAKQSHLGDKVKGIQRTIDKFILVNPPIRLASWIKNTEKVAEKLEKKENERQARYAAMDEAMDDGATVSAAKDYAKDKSKTQTDYEKELAKLENDLRTGKIGQARYNSEKARLEQEKANKDKISRDKLNATISKITKSADKLQKSRQRYMFRRGFYARLRDLLDADNYMEYKYDADGNIKTTAKGYTKRRAARRKKVYDAETNTYQYYGGVKEMAEKLRDDLFGLSSDDKAAIKATTDVAKNAISGMGYMMLGMGAIVDNPAIGFGILAKGVSNYHKASAKKKTGLNVSHKYQRLINKEKRYDYTHNYTKAEFTTGSIISMDETIRKMMITDPDVGTISRLKFMIEHGTLGYKLLGAPFKLTGSMGVMRNTFDGLKGIAEQHLKDLQKYEMEVNNEILKSLAKEIPTLYQKIVELSTEYNSKSSVETLARKRREKNGTIFYTNDYTFLFNGNGNQSILTPKDRLRQAVINTAFDPNSNISYADLNRFKTKLIDKENEFLRKNLIEQLKKQGIIDSQTALSAYDMDLLLKGDHRLVSRRASFEDALSGLGLNQSLIDDIKNRLNRMIYTETTKEGIESIKNEILGLLNATNISDSQKAELQKLLNSLSGVVPKEKIYINGVFDEISKLAEEEPDLVKNKIYESVIADYIKANDISNKGDLYLDSTQKVIDSAYNNIVHKDNLKINVQNILLEAWAEQGGTFEEFKNGIDISRISSENLAKIDALKKNDSKTAEDILNNKKLKDSTDELITDVVKGTLAKNGVIDPNSIDLSDENDPLMVQMLTEMIAALQFAGINISEDKMLTVLGMKKKEISKEDLDKEFVRAKIEEYIADNFGGDASRLNDDERSKLNEYIIELLNQREIIENEQSEKDVQTVLDLLNKKERAEDEIRNLASENNDNNIFDVQDQGTADANLDLKIALPIVSTSVTNDGRVMCDFSLPAGYSADEYSLRIEIFEGNHAGTLQYDSSCSIKNENEHIQATIVHNDSGKHGQMLVIKYPKVAAKVSETANNVSNAIEKNKSSLGRSIIDKLVIMERTDAPDLEAMTGFKSIEDDMETAFKISETVSDVNVLEDVRRNIDKKKTSFARKNDETIALLRKSLKDLDEVYDYREEGVDDGFDELKDAKDKLMKMLLKVKMINDDQEALKVSTQSKVNSEFKDHKKTLTKYFDYYESKDVIEDLMRKRGE